MVEKQSGDVVGATLIHACNSYGEDAAAYNAQRKQSDRLAIL